MNKKMRELLDRKNEKLAQAKAFMDGDDKDIVKAESLIAEAEDIQKEYELEEKLFNMDKSANGPTEKEVAKKAKEDEVEYNAEVITKAVMGRELSKQEKSALLANTTDTAEHGEQYIIPQDIDTTIRESKRQRLAARDLLSVVPVTELAGRHTYDEDNKGKLIPLVDGAEITEADAPKFRSLPWTIEFFAALLPVSNILLKAEKGGLQGYLNRHFVKLSVATENEKVFNLLKKANQTPKAIKGWEALKKSFNTEIDPALRFGSVFVTNQTGFAILDEEKDENGRPILKENPADSTKRLFQGYPVIEFSDDELPNLGANKAPIFFGNLKEYGTLFDYYQLSIATSEHYAFNKNQNTMRVIQGFTTEVVDKTAAIYGALEATPEKPAA